MSFSFVIPVGVDSADGVTALPGQPYQSGGLAQIVGTPLPTAEVALFGSDGNTFMEEGEGSPKIERAEQLTCEHTITMDKATGLFYHQNLPRGTVVSDTQGNVWRMLSNDYERSSDLYVKLHYVMECLSSDSPPDEFQINDISLDIHIIKHPRYWRWLCPYGNDESNLFHIGDTAVASLFQIKEALIRVVQNYIESPFYPSQNMTQNYLQANIIDALQNGSFQVPVTNPTFRPSSPNVAPVVWDGNAASIAGLGNPNCPYYLVPITPDVYADDSDYDGPIHMALAACSELITKLWRQEDTPLIPAYEIVWVQRFFQPIYMNPGGYREDPRDVIPSYFMSVSNSFSVEFNVIPRGDQGDVGPVDTTTNADIVEPISPDAPSIFDYFVYINPQLYSSDGSTGGNLNISSLRCSDVYYYDRTWFAIPHKWKVACVGKWDNDIYPLYGQAAPQIVADYNRNPLDSSGI